MRIPAEPAERSRPGMSTDRITAAALQIVDTEGSQALTMRRLGQALDRKVMTLYRYVPSKGALLDNVIAQNLKNLAINSASADWRQELRDLATSFRGLALAHPNAVPLLSPTLPPPTASPRPESDDAVPVRSQQRRAADGVVARVLTDLAINPAAADWRQELRDLATSFRGLALAHPNAVPLLVTRPLTSPLGQRPPATLRPLEDFLELLIRAGFSLADALHAYRLFFGFLHGHILDELQEIIDNPDEADDLLRLGLHRLSRREFPRIRAVAPELASYDGAAHLQQGVALMITGLQSRFQPARISPTT